MLYKVTVTFEDDTSMSHYSPDRMIAVKEALRGIDGLRLGIIAELKLKSKNEHIFGSDEVEEQKKRGISARAKSIKVEEIDKFTPAKRMPENMMKATSRLTEAQWSELLNKLADMNEGEMIHSAMLYKDNHKNGVVFVEEWSTLKHGKKSDLNMCHGLFFEYGSGELHYCKFFDSGQGESRIVQIVSSKDSDDGELLYSNAVDLSKFGYYQIYNTTDGVHDGNKLVNNYKVLYVASERVALAYGESAFGFSHVVPEYILTNHGKVFHGMTSDECKNTVIDLVEMGYLLKTENVKGHPLSAFNPSGIYYEVTDSGKAYFTFLEIALRNREVAANRKNKDEMVERAMNGVLSDFFSVWLGEEREPDSYDDMIGGVHYVDVYWVKVKLIDRLNGHFSLPVGTYVMAIGYENDYDVFEAASLADGIRDACHLKLGVEVPHELKSIANE